LDVYFAPNCHKVQDFGAVVIASASGLEDPGSDPTSLLVKHYNTVVKIEIIFCEIYLLCQEGLGHKKNVFEEFVFGLFVFKFEGRFSGCLCRRVFIPNYLR
jgi:hypothetical protein